MSHARKTTTVEEAHRQWVLMGNLNIGLMPSGDHQTMAKGGSNGMFASDIFPIEGDGKVPKAPYTTTRRGHTAQPLAQAPSQCLPMCAHNTTCARHTIAACITC